MNFPLRGARESAMTTRYVGALVLPTRRRRMCTATLRDPPKERAIRWRGWTNDTSLRVHSKERGAAPHRWAFGLEPARLLEKGDEARIPVVLLVGTHVRHNRIQNVGDIVALLGVLLLDAVLDARERRRAKLPPRVEVPPDRDFLRREEPLERSRRILADPQDDRVRLRPPRPDRSFLLRRHL